MARLVPCAAAFGRLFLLSIVVASGAMPVAAQPGGVIVNGIPLTPQVLASLQRIYPVPIYCDANGACTSSGILGSITTAAAN